MKRYYCYILSVLLLGVSCTLFKKRQKEVHYSLYVEKLLMPKEDFFRNTHLGMSLEKVKSTEKIKPIGIESNLLKYEIILPKDSTTYEEYADIEYNFSDSDKLDIITGKIYTSQQQLSDSIFRDISRYLNNNFGIAQKDEYDYQVWNGKTINNAEDSININIGIIQRIIEEEYVIIYEIMQE